VHAKRNIQKCNVNDDVCKLMRSLLCLRHPDLDGTLERIQREGEKAGAGMYFCETCSVKIIPLNDV
jgi:hypothetical protein